MLYFTCTALGAEDSAEGGQRACHEHGADRRGDDPAEALGDGEPALAPAALHMTCGPFLTRRPIHDAARP